MKHHSFNLLLLDKTSGKLRHSSLQCLPSQNIHLLFLCGRLSSFDIKASLVYLIGESDGLGLLAFVLNMFHFSNGVIVIVGRLLLVRLYLLSLFLKVSTVHSSFSSFCCSNFDIIFCGNLDFIIDRSSFC